MPIYSYKCPKCGLEFDNFWTVKEYRTPTKCPECESLSIKQVNTSVIFHSNDKGAFVAGYNPALGCEVSTRAEYKKILKERGLVEVGNDKSKLNVPSKRKGISEKLLKEAQDRGAEFSGQEAAALRNGVKLHKEE